MSEDRQADGEGLGHDQQDEQDLGPLPEQERQGGPGLGHDQQDVQDLGPLPEQEEQGGGGGVQPGSGEPGRKRQPGDQTSLDISENVHNVQDEPGSQQTG